MKGRRSAGPEILLQRAQRAIERGQYRRAVRHLERLLPKAGTDPALAEEVHLTMADACLSLREMPQAISHAETAIELNSQNPDGYYLLGFALSVMGEWERAVETLERAVDLAPDNSEYLRALGWAVGNYDDPEQGRALLEEALELAPTHVDVLTDLAMLCAHEQAFDQAVLYAHRAAELAPSDPRVQEVHAVLSHFKSEYERLSGQADEPQPKPTTEAEWRDLIAKTENFNDLVQLWFDLHPAEDLDEVNAGLQQLQDLWNSTPRPELGGRSPNEMIGGRGR